MMACQTTGYPGIQRVVWYIGNTPIEKTDHRHIEGKMQSMYTSALQTHMHHYYVCTHSHIIVYTFRHTFMLLRHKLEETSLLYALSQHHEIILERITH